MDNKKERNNTKNKKQQTKNKTKTLKNKTKNKQNKKTKQNKTKQKTKNKKTNKNKKKTASIVFSPQIIGVAKKPDIFLYSETLIVILLRAFSYSHGVKLSQHQCEKKCQHIDLVPKCEHRSNFTHYFPIEIGIKYGIKDF